MKPHGLVAFPITPMDADGRLDGPQFRGLLQRLARAGAGAVCVLGSTGSYPYLTRDERRHALDVAADELAGRGVALMAGVGALRTDQAVACARDAREAGASLGLLAPMTYTPLNEREVRVHFEAVAETGLALCIYDNPATTHFTVSDELVQALAATPGVTALKSPAPPDAEAGARLAALRRRTPSGFSVGFSGDWRAAAVMLAGADAWYSVLAGLFPRAALAMTRAAAAGEEDTVRRLDHALAPFWALFQAHSSLRVTYAAAQALGLCSHPPPSPVLPLPGPVAEEVGRIVRRLRPLLEDGLLEG